MLIGIVLYIYIYIYIYINIKIDIMVNIWSRYLHIYCTSIAFLHNVQLQHGYNKDFCSQNNVLDFFGYCIRYETNELSKFLCFV